MTPEEIAQYLIFEIEGGNTGHDVINALDNAVLGPHLPCRPMRHWALERMCELEASTVIPQRGLRDAGTAAEHQAPLRSPPPAPSLRHDDRCA